MPTPYQRSVQNSQNFLNWMRPEELHNAIDTGQVKCPNPKCPYVLNDQDYQYIQQDHGWFVCPNCHMSFLMEEDPREGPGGYTRAQGISMTQMGQIGEQIVLQLGQIPTMGKVIKYYGNDVYNNPLDFQIGPYGVEVKTIHSEATPRFKLTGGGPNRNRSEAIAAMNQFCQEYNLKPGMVGVRLNFYTDEADIFAREGFADTFVGSANMPHVGTVNFKSLNPYRDPSQVPPPSEMPNDEDPDQDIPF